MYMDRIWPQPGSFFNELIFVRSFSTAAYLNGHHTILVCWSGFL